jgi:hypothetical protein
MESNIISTQCTNIHVNSRAKMLCCLFVQRTEIKQSFGNNLYLV